VPDSTPRPSHVPNSDEELRALTLGELKPLDVTARAAGA
jgi:hypothetical protein